MHYHSDRDERKRELSSLIGEIMEITDTTRPRICHLMYKRLQEELNVSLDAYLDVVRAETGIRDLTTFDVIVRIDRFYDAAVDLCDYVIEKNTLFG